MKTKYRKYFLVLLGILAALLSGCKDKQPIVEAIDSVTIEIEAAIPTPASFLTGLTENDIPVYLTVPDVTTPRQYPVMIGLDGKEYSSVLNVVDTAPPVFACENKVLLRGEVAPESFVIGLSDATEVEFSFGKAPDYSVLGQQRITVIGTDTSGNSTEVSVMLRFVDAYLTVEASAEPICENTLRELYGLSALEDDRELLPAGYIGNANLILTENENSYEIVLSVEDTMPPTAAAVHYEGYCGYPVTAEQLVTDIKDASVVSVEYQTEPNWEAEGETTVPICLKDEWGNESVIYSEILLNLDTEAPRIYMARDYFCYVNEIRYFANIFATDNADDELVWVVDSSVNPREVGTYPVTYTVSDRAGNTATATLNITVIEQTITAEQLSEVVQETLSRIIKPEMTTTEQVKAIWKYIFKNMRYTKRSTARDDYIAGAYYGLTNLKGDCWNFYAASRALLEEIDGVEVLPIERWGSNRSGHHYWLLVNIRNTGWYHFDAYNVAAGSDAKVFMYTTKQLFFYNTQVWAFKKSLYPEIATVPFSQVISSWMQGRVAEN